MPRRAQPSIIGVFICITVLGVILAYERFYPESVPNACGQVCLGLAALCALVTMYIYHRDRESLTSAILAIMIAGSIGAGLGYISVWYTISSVTRTQRVAGYFSHDGITQGMLPVLELLPKDWI